MNKKLLIVSEDLEQKYHRGIAFYSRSLLRATHSLGYANFLLTGAPSTRTKNLKELLVVKNLVEPVWINYRREKKIFYYLKKHLLSNPFEQIRVNHSNELFKKETKLDFVNYLEGYVNNPYQYLEFDFHPRFFNSPIDLVLPNDTNYKAVLSTSPMPLRVKGSPLIQTLHDTIPVSTLMHPDTSKGLERFYQRLVKMLEHSDYLLSVSEYSRQEILKFFPGHADKIITAHISVPISEQDFKVAQNENMSAALLALNGVAKGEYLFYVGAIEDRKNIEQLIFAYNSIKSKIKIPLVLAGEIGSSSNHLKKLIAENKDVIYLGKIDNISKLTLLKFATAFVFPSKYEGFGIPPLEAMFMGCPVLTSDITSLPEICGDAALYVDPYNIEDMSDKLLEIAGNETLRSQLIEKGYKRVKLFSNEAYSQRLKKVLDTV